MGKVRFQKTESNSTLIVNKKLFIKLQHKGLQNGVREVPHLNWKGRDVHVLHVLPRKKEASFAFPKLAPTPEIRLAYKTGLLKHTQETNTL